MRLIQDLRIDVFYMLVRLVSKRSRQGRMRAFVNLMGVKTGMSILDLGGLPQIWDSVPLPLNITILNLPGCARCNTPTHHNISYVEGDACDISDFKDRSFDLVFSNSVIEHVGSAEKQSSFTREVRRCGKSYWVQTPSIWFPIEAHCGMPFWWFYPTKIRDYFIKNWRKKYPHWAQMVEETTVLSRADLVRLFPEATLMTETLFGLPKSYIAYFAKSSGPGTVKRAAKIKSSYINSLRKNGTLA